MRGSRPPTPERRRRRQVEPLRKTTYQMRASVVEAVKAAVLAGEAASANAFVEEAVEARLREMRRARVYAAYDEAAADPAFLEEMEEVERAFGPAVSDGLGDASERSS